MATVENGRRLKPKCPSSPLLRSITLRLTSFAQGTAGDQIRTGDVQLGKLAFYH
jgi:hypothetical protein